MSTGPSKEKGDCDKRAHQICDQCPATIEIAETRCNQVKNAEAATLCTKSKLTKVSASSITPAQVKKLAWQFCVTPEGQPITGAACVAAIASGLSLGKWAACVKGIKEGGYWFQEVFVPANLTPNLGNYCDGTTDCCRVFAPGQFNKCIQICDDAVRSCQNK